MARAVSRRLESQEEEVFAVAACDFDGVALLGDIDRVGADGVGNQRS